MLALLPFADVIQPGHGPHSSSGTSAWVVLVVVAVIVIGLALIWLLRSRRRSRASGAPSGPPRD